MSLEARSTRGGPVSARVALALLLLSLALVSGVGAGVGPRADIGSAETVALGDPSDASGPESTLAAEPAPPASDSEADGSVAVAEDDAATAEVYGPPYRPSALPSVSAPPRGVRTARFEALEDDVEADELALYVGPTEAAVGVIEGELERGETLSAALAAHGVRPSTVNAISSELHPLFDFHHAQPGQRYRLVLDTRGQLLEFDYFIDADESVHLARTEDGRYEAMYDKSELVPHVVRMAGVVNSTLYSAIESLGEDPSLASAFAAVFAWEFDFTRNVRPGDEFHILYERLYRETRDGRQHYVRPGQILAARYRSGERELEAIHFEPESGRGGYYRTDGTSIERQFLTAPLEYSRISSTYTNARRHPILNITRAHHGIDYAAPHGTPVWAVADGTVIHRGRAGGFGHLVKVRHANGYVSYYSHLSRYASGLHVGQKIKQKEVLGYVGSTGLATGPHVCFRIAKDGRYINPFSIEAPAAEPISLSTWPDFARVRDEMVLRLDGSTAVAVQDAL
jgi:murein DD-endopeptidase MepM/ murein hydrolase activator NlpD